MTAFWLILGFLLTLMILSYLIGDNPFFRIATYLLIGVAAGYTAVIIIYQIILPKMVLPFIVSPPSEWLWVIIPWLLSMMLLTRLFPKVSRIGNIPLGFMVGVAAAVTIGGALLGTISTQLFSVIDLFDPATLQNGGVYALFEGVYILFGTISTLMYFQFFKPKDPPTKVSAANKVLSGIRFTGKIFIAITLGAIFAGVFMASAFTMIERVDFISEVFWSFF